ncbi:amino acid ABC transporter substrate-binding protein [soil metagenome]
MKTSTALAFLALAFGPLLSQPATAASDTLAKIRSTGTLSIGYREASIPFSYLGSDQKPVGFSLELCRALAQTIKTQLRLDKLDVQYVPVNASNRIPLLQNGSIDIECGSTTNTAERQKQVAFSVAIFVSQPSWLVTTASGIKDAAELKGKTVVMTQGSLNVSLGQKINQDDRLDLQVAQTKDHGESLLMVRSGRAAAWCEDNVLEAGMVATSPDAGAFRYLPNAYGGYFYYGLMLRSEDARFKALVDEDLKARMASGEFARLYATWFTQPIQPNGQNLALPMSEALKTRIASPSDALAP